MRATIGTTEVPHRRISFADVIRLAVVRARLLRDPRLEQAQLAKRMSELGFPWHPQTVSSVERGKRRVTAEELLGLSLALETSVSSLLRPVGGLRGTAVTLPGGGTLLPDVVTRSVGYGRYEEGSVQWDAEDNPQWPEVDR